MMNHSKHRELLKDKNPQTLFVSCSLGWREGFTACLIDLDQERLLHFLEMNLFS